MLRLLAVAGIGLFCCSGVSADEAGHAGLVPGWWSIPFMLLLSCIAFVPFIHKPFWEKFFARISLGLAAIVALLYVTQLGAYGREMVFETALEYFKFIALIGSLYVVSGGILIDISGGGNVLVNVLLLAAGMILANIVGTTGASALLIRPFLRINGDRLRPFHTVFFIFIVSNCAGVLTPIGDPPLFLGYINGVPFEWTILHCWAPWLVANGFLLAAFAFFDSRTPATKHHNRNKLAISGKSSIACLGVVLFGVFLDRILSVYVSPSLEPYPFGAVLMLAAAFFAYRTADKRILEHNGFSFGPIEEVALLFIGIFATMMPALAYLAAHAGDLGLHSPGGFYFACGSLSSFLDNAPAYSEFPQRRAGTQGNSLKPGWRA